MKISDFLAGAKGTAKEKLCRRKRTPRQVLGMMTLRENGPQFPHHQYDVDNADQPPRVDVSSGSSDDDDDDDEDDQEIGIPNKMKLDFDLSEEEFELRRCNRIVIQEHSLEKIPKLRKMNHSDDIISSERSNNLFHEVSDHPKGESGKLNGKKKNKDVDKPAPELPEEVLSRMNLRAMEKGQKEVERMVFVIEKVLEKSDVLKQQNRLSIPKKQINPRNEFLDEKQEIFLEKKRPDGHKNHMEVPIIEPSGRVGSVSLRKWPVGNHSFSFVLNGNWKDVVEFNKLEDRVKLAQQIVQVWAFWINNDLNFAFAFPGVPYQQHAVAHSSLDNETASRKPGAEVGYGYSESER